MSKIRHTFLGFKEVPKKNSHSFYGEGVKPMPYVMFGIDYCNDENELKTENPEKDNTSFLKTLKKNIHK